MLIKQAKVALPEDQAEALTVVFKDKTVLKHIAEMMEEQGTKATLQSLSQMGSMPLEDGFETLTGVRVDFSEDTDTADNE
jgi:hypothetical protein